jgi:hypothetical protein
MATLKSERVVRQWSALVEGGAGKDHWVLDQTERRIKEASPPPVSSRQEEVSSGLFGEKRDFLIVTHKRVFKNMSDEPGDGP